MQASLVYVELKNRDKSLVIGDTATHYVLPIIRAVYVAEIT